MVREPQPYTAAGVHYSHALAGTSGRIPATARMRIVVHAAVSGGTAANGSFVRSRTAASQAALSAALCSPALSHPLSRQRGRPVLQFSRAQSRESYRRFPRARENCVRPPASMAADARRTRCFTHGLGGRYTARTYARLRSMTMLHYALPPTRPSLLPPALPLCTDACCCRSSSGCALQAQRKKERQQARGRTRGQDQAAGGGDLAQEAAAWSLDGYVMSRKGRAQPLAASCSDGA